MQRFLPCCTFVRCTRGDQTASEYRDLMVGHIIGPITASHDTEGKPFTKRLSRMSCAYFYRRVSIPPAHTPCPKSHRDSPPPRLPPTGHFSASDRTRRPSHRHTCRRHQPSRRPVRASLCGPQRGAAGREREGGRKDGGREGGREGGGGGERGTPPVFRTPPPSPGDTLRPPQDDRHCPCRPPST
jgi:hypothetical protein